MIRRLLLRHHRRFAPALDLAALGFRAGAISYDAFDAHNAEVLPAIQSELSLVLGARGTYELFACSARFEARFAAWCGRTHGVGLGSGTAALHLTLLALGVGPGDEVITSAHTYLATVLAIQNTGATPILVDPDPTDLCIRADAVARAITARTRAIIPVHMHGHVADMAGVLALAAARKLHVVEDCAQAHGARLGDKPVPIGPIGCFSFYASKPLGGAGNGGMVVTDDADLAERLRVLRDPEGGTEEVLRSHRTPSWLDAMEAAVLTARLPRMDAWAKARAENAAAYAAALAHLDPVRPAPGVQSAHYSFVIRPPDRDAMKRALLFAGIETKAEYSPSLVVHPTFRTMGWRAADFPVATRAATSGLSLPVHPFVTPAERARVIAEVTRIAS